MLVQCQILRVPTLPGAPVPLGGRFHMNPRALSYDPSGPFNFLDGRAMSQKTGSWIRPVIIPDLWECRTIQGILKSDCLKTEVHGDSNHTGEQNSLISYLNIISWMAASGEIVMISLKEHRSLNDFNLPVRPLTRHTQRASRDACTRPLGYTQPSTHTSTGRTRINHTSNNSKLSAARCGL
ncbi:hypothetical protein RRG08_041423 [Elysia crispata]|uniref:Uncharacterized protein n=1 Tax=Elysia crispata TaxID=231223 RepID=A0AAE1CLB4_9GAST|nr:hypothetical protein RRG08_041423 [Elysia crispata]